MLYAITTICAKFDIQVTHRNADRIPRTTASQRPPNETREGIASLLGDTFHGAIDRKRVRENATSGNIDARILYSMTKIKCGLLDQKLESGEKLLTVFCGSGTIDLKHRKSLSLRSGTCLANSDLIPLAQTEARGGMGRDVAMALLETLVLADPMKIVPTHDDGLLHFRGDDDTTEQTAANGDVTGKGTFLVDVGALDGFARCLNAETDVAKPAALLATYATDEGDCALLREGFVVKNVSHNAAGGGCWLRCWNCTTPDAVRYGGR